MSSPGSSTTGTTSAAGGDPADDPRAAARQARLLIIESVIAPGNDPDGAKWLDLLMLVLAGGRERTEAEWRTLLDAAGFESGRDRRRTDRGDMPLTVGTAGHIDHGKTWLVRALTGKDTDRLPEERERGISIDLGYAPLDLPDGRRLSLVDVPGHERFVRTMVAGATGIDLFLLVVDATEGARPQTHEHLAILRLLGVERGRRRGDEGGRRRRGDARARDSRRRTSSCPARRSSP